jgi:hypothetical protein
VLESGVRWTIRKLMGSKKGGDYCWSIFSGEAYRPLGVGSEEPAKACPPRERRESKPGGGKPPPKPV